MVAITLVLAGCDSSGSGDSEGGTSTPQVGKQDGAATNLGLTVENTERKGVWALKSPIMKGFASKAEPPPNASRWIPNGHTVIAMCARVGNPYKAEVEGEFETWRWYAQLKSGAWLPMAGFQETVEDGPFGLRDCAS